MRLKIIILVFFIISFLLILARDPLLLREAEYYEKLSGNYVRCTLCPNYCLLADKQKGICGVRQNIGGKLFSLVYNQPVSLNVDPVEKKPLYHVRPGSNILSLATVGCNLRCNFCQNWTISQTRPEQVTPYFLTPGDIIETARENQCEMIAFTYTEPTVFYEYMLDIAKLARENGMNTVLVTCGYINEAPLLELIPYLDACNIDLKGFSDEFYNTYTTGSLQPVLNTIKTCHENNLYFELTNLVIPQANDDPELIREMCRWIKTTIGTEYPLHFSRFFPHYQLTNRPPTPRNSLLLAEAIAREEGLKYVYIGNMPGLAENTCCPQCGNLLIERSGYRIIINRLEQGKCPDCGYSIKGIFE